MEESKFNQYIDDTLLAIEEAVDEMSLDIDYDTIGGILTLEFPNKTKIIINRQAANNQLWVAARSGGFHLDFIEGQWFSKKDDCNLQELLDRLFSDQAESEVQLNLELLF